jgi:hypothetical protein
MKKWKKKKMEYLHRREGDLVKVEIRDETRRMIYRNKFNINDKVAIINFLQVLESYSKFNIAELIREKLRVGEWW